ncbi:MAG: triose-phosphate isomerase [Christensenellaceae bacterium]|jgi:triosephosphate isomerase|nr:triose-phosphate isomerase [Christensenellaceae bacterium]
MKKLIVANWKMNKTREETHNFFKAFAEKNLKSDREVVFCPPFTNLAIAREYADEGGFEVGAQNFYPAAGGTNRTGEISANMLDEIGVRWVLLGHSECREIFGETVELVTQKVDTALENKLLPILCVGETLTEMEGKKTESVLKKQLASFKKDSGIVVAYEPVWAIGTGKTATTAQIIEVHTYIKSIVGKDTPVLYGGSVNDKNATEILTAKGVDGVLVGGASLDPDKFTAIINA